MIVEIKATSDGIGYASKNPYEWEGKSYEADIQDGDVVEILNEGSVEEGKFGSQHYFKIKTRNGEKKAPFNQSSINVVAGKYGIDTSGWVGKEVTILTKKGVFAGTKGIAVYYVTEGWYLDDFGDLVNDADIQTTPEAVEPPVSNKPDYPESKGTPTI